MREEETTNSTLTRVLARGAKHFFIAVSLVVIVVVVANVLRPENAIRLGSGFTSIVPAVYYPAKLSLLLATVYFGLSIACRGTLLAIAYVTLLLSSLVYLFYCINIYVTH